MIIDLHVHTRHYSGCSIIEEEDLLEQAAATGLDGLVLTEHGILWPKKRLVRLQKEAADRGLLVLAGQEITCLSLGRRQDFLVFGVDRSLGTASSARELIDIVHQEGGVVVAAHPFKKSRLGLGYHGAGDEVGRLPLDAAELLHPDHDQAARKKLVDLAQKRGLPLTGGSDAHELHQLGRYATQFESPVRELADLVYQIKLGRITPVNGDREHSGE